MAMLDASMRRRPPKRSSTSSSSSTPSSGSSSCAKSASDRRSSRGTQADAASSGAIRSPPVPSCAAIVQTAIAPTAPAKLTFTLSVDPGGWMRLGRLDYKWVALSNTTLGMLIATINGSVLLIAVPHIFRGLPINPLAPGNTSYLLWLILGFLVVIAVLVVSLGRLGDMYGRVKMFNLGFAVFTVFSILLSVTWLHGSAGALWLILMRVGQGVGGALLFANSSAILTDAFPANQRGLALGVNSIAAIAGSFIGLVLGGVLAPVSWRLVFLVSVPVGLFATVWAYRSLRDTGERREARIDWWGNLTFAAGLILLMVGITYGIQPYGGPTRGGTAPVVEALSA